MPKPFEFVAEARGDLLVVTEPAAQTKLTDQPQLILKRRADTDDHRLLAQAWEAANQKARELGWTV